MKHKVKKVASLRGTSTCITKCKYSSRSEKSVRCVACQRADNSINAGQARGQLCSGYRNEDMETNRVKSSRKEQFQFCLNPMSALVMKNCIIFSTFSDKNK